MLDIGEAEDDICSSASDFAYLINPLPNKTSSRKGISGCGLAVVVRAVSAQR